MFIFKFFRKSFIFPKLLIKRNENIFKILIYFALLIMIANFPANFEVIKQQGSRLDFIEESFRVENPINWNIPLDMEIKGGKLVTNSDEAYTNVHKGLTYVINNKETINKKEDYKNHIFLNEDKIIYIDDKGNFMEGYGYKGFTSDIYSFMELELASGEHKAELFRELGRSIEKSFSSYIVLYTLIRNSIINIVVSLVFVLILAIFVQLFKFKYASFMTYIEGLKFVILSLGLPALLSFIFGLFAPVFSVVVFQLATGMVVMLVLLIYSNKSFT